MLSGVFVTFSGIQVKGALVTEQRPALRASSLRSLSLNFDYCALDDRELHAASQRIPAQLQSLKLSFGGGIISSGGARAISMHLAERVATTSSEWHAFGGGVPLVRQHSQGASRRGSPPVPSLLFPRHHISRSTSPTPPCALALTAPLTAPAPRRAELQCMVQTAFDEMEAALALGRKNCPQACAEGHQRGEPAAGTNT